MGLRGSVLSWRRPTLDRCLGGAPGPHGVMSARREQHRLSRHAARVRGAARSPPAPLQDARDRHRQHPDRVHHPEVPRVPGGDAVDVGRRRGRLPGDGGDARLPQVARAGADAGAARRDGRGAGVDLDPREELIRRLLEYQKYKDAAEKLGGRPIEGRTVFARGMPIERRRCVGAAPGRAVGLEADRGVRQAAGQGRQGDLDPRRRRRSGLDRQRASTSWPIGWRRAAGRSASTPASI